MAVPSDVAAKISNKKAMYGRYIDTKEWAKFDQVVLPDATLNFYDSDGSILMVGGRAMTFDSSEAFTTFFKTTFAKAQTLHMFGPGELHQISPEEIKAIWSMEDEIIIRATAGLVEIRGGGYYHEIWSRKDGNWFLKSLDLHRTYMKTSILASVLMILQKYLGFSIA